MKTIIITGCSRGIGFSLLKKFADDSDCKVIAISRNIKPIEELLSNKDANRYADRILPFSFDLTASDYNPLFEFVSGQCNSIDILINNAGFLVNKTFEEISSVDLYMSYVVNVFAPFQLIQHLLPLLKNGKCHIVNLGSMGGFQGSSKFSGLAAYSSSKSALAGLTECLAEELKPFGIVVNCLALGSVQTEMLEEAFPGYIAPVTPDEIASFIHQFSLTGNRYFNGKIIPVSTKTP